MKREGYTVAVLGAGRLVGREVIAALQDRQFPVDSWRLLETDRYLGEIATFDRARAQLVSSAGLDGVDLLFGCASEELSAEWVPRAVEAGAVAIDLTQVFSPRPDVPLIVPGVNSASLAEYDPQRIIAIPTAAATALTAVLKPLLDVVDIERAVVASYESVATAAVGAIEELTAQVGALLNGRESDAKVFPHRIAFNVLPQVGELLEGGQTLGEARAEAQVRRILGDPDFCLSVTRALVPSFYGTALAVNLQTSPVLPRERAREVLRGAPGVLMVDDPAGQSYPTFVEAVTEDAVCVGRIREDASIANGLNVWITIDETRKGAAVNAVQIAELLIRDYL